MRKSSVGTGVLSLLLLYSIAAAQAPQNSATSKTLVVLLGTGNPGPDPDRSGPATAWAFSDQSGNLHVTKECSQYTGAAGSFCTITSSQVQ